MEERPCGKIGKESDAAGKMIGFRKWTPEKAVGSQEQRRIYPSQRISRSQPVPSSQRLLCDAAPRAVVIRETAEGERERGDSSNSRTTLRCRSGRTARGRSGRGRQRQRHVRQRRNTRVANPQHSIKTNMTMFRVHGCITPRNVLLE